MDKTPKSFRLNFSDLDITSSLLEVLMGYTEQDVTAGPVSDSILEILEIAESLCNIRGGYIISNPIMVDKENKRIISHDQVFETKQIVTHQLRRSEQAAWFLCTAGEKISQYARQLADDGNLVKGYVADVLANAVIEASMDKIQEALRIEMSAIGMKITNRYSPGYCDWDITEQKKLFKIFPENYLDISLSQSCLMLPVKSISGIIGIGTEVKFNDYTCNVCGDLKCIYKKRRE